MKQNSTFVGVALCALIFLSFNLNTVNAQCTSPAMSWRNVSLVSGTALTANAVYKFPSVTPGVDAYVTVKSIVGGATLTSIDDNTYGYQAAWQPVVKTPTVQGASESYVAFKIEFKDAIDSAFHTYDCFALSFIDVDGDNNGVREFVATKGSDSYTVSNITSLIVSQSAGFTKAIGPITNYAGLDTSAYVTNINFRYTNAYKVDEVRVGNVTNASFNVQNRYTCAYFAPISMPWAAILPIKYISFDAMLINNKTVNLNWITEQEINNNLFEVERSFDMKNYSTLGIVLDGFVTNGTGKSYQYKDNSLALEGRNIVYYRLKQVDNDGQFTYSKIVAVNLKQSTNETKMQVFPNPFAQNISAGFTANETGLATITIVNSNGQVVMTKQTSVNKGNSTIQINGLGRLTPGMYIARLTLNGVVIDNQKIIKN